MRAIFLIVILSSISIPGLCHPVSYKGSRGLMGFYSPIFNHNQINYSFEYWLAGGIHFFQSPNPNRRAAFLSSNFLLKRWNGKNFQSNFYAVIGLGGSSFRGDQNFSGLGLLQFDIEDRDYYFLAKHIGVFSDMGGEIQQSVVRAGFSPYVGDFEDIHSWIIFEFQSMKFADDREILDVTPFLRLFYKNLLFEIGHSYEGVTRFNYIVHF